MSFLKLYFNFLKFFIHAYVMFMVLLSTSKKLYKFHVNELKLGKLIYVSSFLDSGILDFFVLSLFDLLFRYVFVYSLLLLSEFSVVEKASWRFFSYLVSGISKYSFFEINNIWDFFFMLLLLIVFIYSIFAFIYILFI